MQKNPPFIFNLVHVRVLRDLRGVERLACSIGAVLLPRFMRAASGACRLPEHCMSIHTHQADALGPGTAGKTAPRTSATCTQASPDRSVVSAAHSTS